MLNRCSLSLSFSQKRKHCSFDFVFVLCESLTVQLGFRKTKRKKQSGDASAREITVMRGRFEKPCYIYGRKLPTSSGIWSLFYSLLVCCCAYCKYVSFQLSFFLWGGEGSRQGLGFTCERKEGDEYRVFCYCLIQG